MLSFALSNLSLLVVLYIIVRLGESIYKVLCLLVVLDFPLPGTALYLCLGNKRTGKVLEKKLSATKLPALTKNGCRENIASQHPRLAQTVEYLEDMAGATLFRGGEIRYFQLGEKMLPDMLAVLGSTTRLIYLEYFILSFDPTFCCFCLLYCCSQKESRRKRQITIYHDVFSADGMDDKPLLNAVSTGIWGVR